MYALLSLISLPLAVAATVEERDVYVDGLRLHLREAGPPTAQPVLLVHGFMVSSATYAGLIERLAERYHVVAYDAPGHGQSARPSRRMRGAYIASVTKRLLEQLDLREVIVVGQSMGAMTALNLAARWPERISQVIAVNPAGFSPGPWRSMGMQLLFSPGAYASGPELGYWLAARGSSVAFEAQSQTDLDEQLRLRRDPGWSHSVASVYRTIQAGELDRLAASVRVPVTLVFGEEDSAYPEAYRERVSGLLPRAAVVRLPACGHNVHHDAPARLVRVIDAVAAGERPAAVMEP